MNNVWKVVVPQATVQRTPLELWKRRMKASRRRVIKAEIAESWKGAGDPSYFTGIADELSASWKQQHKVMEDLDDVVKKERDALLRNAIVEFIKNSPDDDKDAWYDTTRGISRTVMTEFVKSLGLPPIVWPKD
jgi:hypothetical protein